jgi:two-component system sensor histidine kinase UhpB
MRARLRHTLRMPLLWRAFAINAGVLVLAALVLLLSPATVSSEPRASEAIVLLAGAGVLLLANLVLLRRTFEPLRRLTAFMRGVEPMVPWRRVRVAGEPGEVRELAAAFNEMLDRLEAERRTSGARALAAMEGERMRIARELHDEVGQTLTSVVLQLDGGSVLEAREAARGAVEEVRTIAQGLRPEALDDFGLRTALISLGSSLTDRTGLRVLTRIAPSLPALEYEHELAIYRVAQESLTNAVRHAGAGSVEVRLEWEADRLVLRVRDDGRGIEPHAADVRGGGAGDGIRGMRERALLIGGRLDVRECPEGGTEVRLEVPG